jgi:hypothetical protein
LCWQTVEQQFIPALAIASAVSGNYKKMRHIFTFILTFPFLLAFGQNNCDPKDFEQLKSACRKNTLTEQEFSSYLMTIRKLEKNDCIDYIQKRNGHEYVETGLTYLFGQICIIANSDKSVREYIGYLKRNSGSAEEQRSFSFEYIFKQNPTRVLTLIGFDKELLDHLVWGFMNNRMYGEKDPYEKDPNKAYTRYESEPKQVLTVQTYKDIFYKTYPSLKNDKSFNKQIEYLLTTIHAGLNERK